MIKIAVGEDSLVERKLLELILAGKPEFSVTLCDNGLHLWHHIWAEPPDLIIVDLLLTGLDGFSFCRLLRSHRRFAQSPPVLAVSSMTVAEVEETILAHGATAFLPKPIEPDALLQQVRKLVATPPTSETYRPLEIPQTSDI